MKKAILVILGLAVIAAAFGFAFAFGTTAYAQTPAPQATPGAGWSGGQGRMGGGMWNQTQPDGTTPYGGGMGRMRAFAQNDGQTRGGRGGMMANGQEGPLHTDMVAYFADKFGMKAEDLEARLDKGETMAQIAQEKGISADQFNTLMQEARVKAIDNAVAKGTITKEQGDWMKQRGQGRGGMGMRGGAGCTFGTTATPAPTN